MTDERLPAGTRVEVRTAFDGRWARGFEVAEALPEGYRILRVSDGVVLPALFNAEGVRRERKRQGLWWY